VGVLSRLRGVASEWGAALAPLLARASSNPNHYTLAGVAAALGAVLAAYAGLGPHSVALMLASGALDALDGLVARYSGRASRAGAFLDSAADRVSDSLYHLALALLGVDPIPVIASLSASLTTSYIRARGESLGVGVAGVGLVERQERVVALALVGLAAVYYPGLAGPAAWALAFAGWATVAQRTLYVYSRLSRGG